MTQTSAVPAKLVPASVPSLRVEGEFYTFSKPAIEFLRAYSVNVDVDAAFTEARVDTRHRNEILENPHVKREMARIQETFQYGARLTTGYVGGRHMRMMSKVEDEFDNATGTDGRMKSASVFAKMSETAMKAAGLIGAVNPDQLPTVIMNINTGGGDAQVQINQATGVAKQVESAAT